MACPDPDPGSGPGAGHSDGINRTQSRAQNPIRVAGVFVDRDSLAPSGQGAGATWRMSRRSRPCSRSRGSGWPKYSRSRSDSDEEAAATRRDSVPRCDSEPRAGAGACARSVAWLSESARIPSQRSVAAWRPTRTARSGSLGDRAGLRVGVSRTRRRAPFGPHICRPRAKARIRPHRHPLTDADELEHGNAARARGNMRVRNAGPDQIRVLRVRPGNCRAGGTVSAWRQT